MQSEPTLEGGREATSDAHEIQTTADELSKEEIFDVLGNSRRRCIVHYLKQQTARRIEIRELVDYVAAWEANTSLENVSSSKRKSVYAAVKQTHLPKMEDAGVIRFYRSSGEVELTGNVEAVQMYLEFVPKNEIPWSEYYLGLAAVGLTLVVSSWVNIYPFGLVPPLIIAAIIAVVLAVSATVHVYTSAQRRLGADEYELKGAD